MAFGPQTRPVATEEELLALAASLEAEAAQRYRDLADWAAEHEEPALEALFNELAAMEAEHGTNVLSASLKRLGHAAAPAAMRWQVPPLFDDPELRSALLTRYRALSIAVRNEERSFAFYAEVSAYAPTPAVRALAEDLARAELEHAAILRRARRAAYRSERTAPEIEPPADLPALDRQSMAWEAEAANAATRAAQLRALSRNVERYLLIAEKAKDEAVLSAAQDRAAQALLQLAKLRDSDPG